MEIYVIICSLICNFIFYLVYSHNFVIYIDFTHTAASNTATDDVTNQVTHRIFNTNL